MATRYCVSARRDKISNGNSYLCKNAHGKLVWRKGKVIESNVYVYPKDARSAAKRKGVTVQRTIFPVEMFSKHPRFHSPGSWSNKVCIKRIKKIR